MISLFYDLSITHNKDHICLTNRRQTMRYDETGMTFHEFCKGILNLHLCSGINGRRCFIQNQHGRVTEHQSCNTQKLLLTLGKSDAILTDAEEALTALGELTGKSIREDLVATIFSRFCVGK